MKEKKLKSAITECHKYNTIQYKNEYYYSGINPVEFRGHIKTVNCLLQEIKN